MNQINAATLLISDTIANIIVDWQWGKLTLQEAIECSGCENVFEFEKLCKSMRAPHHLQGEQQ